MQFLMGINKSFSQFRAQVLMFDPLLVISQVFSLVMQEEIQRSIYQGVSKDFVDRQLGSTSHVATVGGTKRYLNNRGSKEGRAELLCSHCGYTNHTVENVLSYMDILRDILSMIKRQVNHMGECKLIRFLDHRD